jgi:hypothetical protein
MKVEFGSFASMKKYSMGEVVQEAGAFPMARLLTGNAPGTRRAF